MYCTLDGTPLSKAEVTMDSGAYQDVTDPSVYVKFKLDDGSTLLAWTTTPWTLPANTALAVNPELDYVEVKVGDEQFILAEELAAKVLTDEKHQSLQYEVLRKIKGTELVGKKYQPLLGVDRGENAHLVWAADYVSNEDGTGIVHIAPAYGEEDFELAKEHNIPVVHVIDQNGFYTESDWKDQNVWEANKPIAKDLHERGVVWKIEYIRHSYPHCHRCGTRLMYRAHPSWFVNIDSQRELMLEKNEPINWFPEHVKYGRFQKNIEQAPDWNISRDRFWATAMPVWKSPTGKVNVVGSYAELKELSGVELDDYHRPWIDEVVFDLDGETYTRIDKVMDSWFEAGSMPFAQFHYPFENVEKFEKNFPGDFIVEYIGQVRAWFYYMHAMSIALFGTNSFKNVIVTGNVAGNDGRKMSKSYGNYTDPNELMDKFSADSLRFLLLSSPLLNGEDFALQDKEVGDIARKLGMIWNMFDFFTMYAEVDGWEFDPEKPFTLNPDDLASPLDKWIVSRIHQLNQHITEHMDAYNIPDAMAEVMPFIDDASNWYVRRSRRRFWKSDDDADKNDAYRTLHYVLLKLSVILAPFVPFLSEELYQKLGGGNESVHLLNWPTNYSIDEAALTFMAEARKIIEQGLALRMFKSDDEPQVKIRQPLSKLSYTGQKLDPYYENMIAEEVNVKVVEYAGAEGVELVGLDKNITPELKREGLMREVVRVVQNARKQAGLNVDDRINLSLKTEDQELQAAIAEHAETIKNETLALELSDGEYVFKTETKVDSALLIVSLEKH